MCEKACHLCFKAKKINDGPIVETSTEIFFINNNLVNEVVAIKVADARVRYIRNCSRGGQTVRGFDKCISKLEFREKA